MSSSSEERGPVGLLADEFLARCQRGERPTIQEYCDRRPELAGEIRDVFEALLMVEDLRPGTDDVSGSAGEARPVGGKQLQQVGDYRILCEIGRGGMGVVYEAEQQALGRRVALKVLPRTSAGDGSAQLRFQREARAAARLHHTNIVPVFDVGQDGEHLYYAMQRIHGQGLDLVIQDLKRLRAQSEKVSVASADRAGERSIAASLEAGQFAKENLALAADPDSQATGAYEGSVPSSAMLPGQSEISTATSNRQAYFRSVAQIGVQTAAALSYAHSRGIIHRDIKPGNLILDTTGNVWVTDFGLAKTGDGGMTHTGDILGTVRYMSPERFRGQCDVRADVYALGMTLYELLTLKPAYASGDRLKLIELIRQTEAASPRSVDGRIPRDLETIVMKAIDKDPKRRYQSADEMGEDLQRFVNDEPIKARRIGSVERLGRWCRRNPAVAGLMATVLVLMAAGTAVSSWQAVVANRARAELAAKNAELTDEQAKVQARFDMAAKAIALFHTGVSEDMLLKNPEFKELRTKLLKQAAGFYTDLEKLLAGQTDAKSRRQLAAAYFQLGELTNKIGDKKAALAVHHKALALRRELAAAEGADVQTRLDVARSLEHVGKLLQAMGDYAGALAAFEGQRDLAERLETEHPTDTIRSVLGQSYDAIGETLMATGKLEAALASYHKALAIQQKLADANPAVTQFQNDLASNYNGIGATLRRMGKAEEALASYHNALAIQQKLADANPAVTQFQNDLALLHNNIGANLRNAGKPEEALASFRQALALWQKLAEANAAVTGFQSSLALLHNNIGLALWLTGQWEEALASHRQALALWQKLAEANPAVTQFQIGQHWSHDFIGDVLRDTGKPEEALASYRKALAIKQKLADANPANTQFRNALVRSQNNIVLMLARTGKSDQALKDLEERLQRAKAKYGPDHPATLAALDGVAAGYLAIAAQQAWLGQEQEWAATCERGLSLAGDTRSALVAEVVAKMSSLRPSNDQRHRAALLLAQRAVELGKGHPGLAGSQMALGMAEYRSGHFAEADAALRAAMEAGKGNPKIAGTSAFYRALSLFRQGKRDEARQLATQAAAKMKPLPKDAENPLASGGDAEDLILWLAYKEAKAMIQFDENRAERAP